MINQLILIVHWIRPFPWTLHTRARRWWIFPPSRYSLAREETTSAEKSLQEGKFWQEKRGRQKGKSSISRIKSPYHISARPAPIYFQSLWSLSNRTDRRLSKLLCKQPITDLLFLRTQAIFLSLCKPSLSTQTLSKDYRLRKRTKVLHLLKSAFSSYMLNWVLPPFYLYDTLFFLGRLPRCFSGFLPDLSYYAEVFFCLCYSIYSRDGFVLPFCQCQGSIFFTIFVIWVFSRRMRFLCSPFILSFLIEIVFPWRVACSRNCERGRAVKTS